MSKLLINENPLQVLPSLAVALGLNQAIFLQQVHYWLQTSGKVRDGRKWIYNSAAAWQKQFPFWCTRTIKSVIKSLEESGLLVSANYNAARFDKTKWYTIDYAKLDKIGQSIVQELPSDSAKSAPCYSANVAQPIPEIETTSEIRPADAGASKYAQTDYALIEDAFSASYKTKTGKAWQNTAYGAGRKALKNLLQSGADPDTIADMARAYVEQADGKYRPYTILAFVKHYNDIQASAPKSMKQVAKELSRHKPLEMREEKLIFLEDERDEMF